MSELSQKSFSGRAVFQPRQWRNGREPCDLVFFNERAMIVFSMTQGKSYLQDLIEHNLGPCFDRLKEWRDEGRTIRGDSLYASFSIGWQDVDTILVVSVVDGVHAASVAHPLGKFSELEKVAACVTITGSALAEIAKLGGGARDIVHFCEAVCEDGEIIDTARSLAMAHGLHDWIKSHLVMNEAAERPSFIMTGIGNVDVDFYVSVVLGAAKQEGNEPLFAELDWFDVYWLAATSKSFVSMIEQAPKNETAPRSAYGRSNISPLRIGVLAVSNLENARTIADQTSAFEKNDLTFVVHLDIGLGAIMFVAGVPSPSPLALDISKLRSSASVSPEEFELDLQVDRSVSEKSF